jgi:hypothetical protein
MLADVLSPIYFSPPGLLVCSLLSLAGIVLIEGTVLRLLRWGSWKITFLHAFIINLISSLVGTGLLIFSSHLLILAGPGYFDYPFPPLILLLGAFLVTVIVEAGVLKALRQSPSFSRILLNSFVANFFSYLFLFVMISFALVFPLFGYRNRPIPHPRPTPFLSPSPSASPST